MDGITFITTFLKYHHSQDLFLFLNLGNHKITLRFTEGRRRECKDRPSFDMRIIFTHRSLPNYTDLCRWKSHVIRWHKIIPPIILKRKKMGKCNYMCTHAYTHSWKICLCMNPWSGRIQILPTTLETILFYFWKLGNIMIR